MTSPSPLDLYIARAIGARTRPLEEAIHRSALRRLGRRKPAPADNIEAPIIVRAATTQDATAIARLALLDGHRLPAGRQIVAEAGGEILAAAEVASGTTVADPFRPSAGVARLVTLRAEQLRPQRAA